MTGATRDGWETMQTQAGQASQALDRLGNAGPALAALASSSVEDLQAQVKAASASLREVQRAIAEKDVSRVETALQKFRRSFEPVHDTARQPAS